MVAARRRRQANRTADEPRTIAARSAFSVRTLWMCVLLIAVDLAVYAPVWRHEFTDYDDPVYITQNPQVSGGLTWRGVVWAFTTTHAANWHPLTWLSHMLDVELYGVSPGPHLLTSVVLHVASTLLLFGALQRMTGQAGRSAVVAALFGVHPLHVESVAWAAERKDALSTLCWMLTLWAYVAYVRRPQLGRYLGVGALFALGLLAKPMLVTLPFVLLLLDFWPLRRLSPGTGSGATLGVVTEKLPLLALSVASSLMTFVAQARGGAVGELEAFPFGQRIANAMVSYVVYIGKTVWPTSLAAFYPLRDLPPLWTIAGALALIGASVAVIRAARRAPYLPVGWFWYLGTLTPVIGLVQVGSQRMADRYTYVPLIGLFIVLAWGIPDLLARWSYRRIALPVAAGLAIVTCALIAGRQVQFWKNSEALWTHALQVTTDNHIAHNKLGDVRAAQGRLDAAVTHYTEALRISPGFMEVHNNLGVVLARLGRADEALTHYTEALRSAPSSVDAHNNLGNILTARGRVDEGIAHYLEALRLRPDFVAAHNNLGVALARTGRSDEAIREFLEALRIKPDYGDAHFNVAAMLARKGQLTEAARHYRETLRSNPANAEAHYRLGLVLRDQGNIEDAARHFEAAVRLNPGLEKARQALGVVTGR